MRSPESFFPVEVFGAVKAVLPVTAGLSAAGSYMVSTDAGEFFLRLHAAGRGGFEEMLAAQRLAAARGIAPAVVLADEDARAVVSAKVEGAPFGLALVQPETRLRALGNLCETLARLHATPTSDLPRFEPSRGKELWDQQLGRAGFPAWATPLGAVIDAGIEALENDKRRVFSHNDVNPANLLWDGAQVWMVDWEGAALAHPYLDLATFAVFLNFSDDDAIGLLAIQEGQAISAEQRTTFILLRNFARVFYGAVLFSLIPDLAKIGFQSREETLTLSECHGRLARDELDLKTPFGQGLLAGAILRDVQTVHPPAM
jgi:aminoglycoside phosphotransferase (APT) family kinase protein